MAIDLRSGQLWLKLQREGFGALVGDDAAILCEFLKSQATSRHRPALGKLSDVVAVVDRFLKSDAIRVGFIRQLDSALWSRLQVIKEGTDDAALREASDLYIQIQERIKVYDRTETYE